MSGDSIAESEIMYREQSEEISEGIEKEILTREISYQSTNERLPLNTEEKREVHNDSIKGLLNKNTKHQN